MGGMVGGTGGGDLTSERRLSPDQVQVFRGGNELLRDGLISAELALGLGLGLLDEI